MNHEKNNSDIDHLKQVLAKSFDGSEGDDVPPMPEGLRDRIADQYGRTAPTQAVEKSTGESFFSLISQLFRKPAFAVGMAAVIMLVVATAVFNRPDSTPGFRGGDDPSSVTLVLHQIDAPATAAIKGAGFDKNARIAETSDAGELDKALEAKGVRIVVDQAAGKILGYMPGEAQPAIEEDLPSDPAALAAKVAVFQAELLK